MSEQETTDWPETVQHPLISPTSGEESLRRRLLEILLAPAEPRKMTYEEFLAWADEDTLAEWVALPGGEAGGGNVRSGIKATSEHRWFFCSRW